MDGCVVLGEALNEASFKKGLSPGESGSGLASPMTFSGCCRLRFWNLKGWKQQQNILIADQALHEKIWLIRKSQQNHARPITHWQSFPNGPNVVAARNLKLSIWQQIRRCFQLTICDYTDSFGRNEVSVEHDGGRVWHRNNSRVGEITGFDLEASLSPWLLHARGHSNMTKTCKNNCWKCMDIVLAISIKGPDSCWVLGLIQAACTCAPWNLGS